MDIPDPSRVIRDIEDEPHALDRKAASSREGDTVFGEQRHQSMHDLLAVEDELQPPERRDQPNLSLRGGLRIRMRDASSGVPPAQMRIAAKRERAAALGSFAKGLR
jgi:hypothetical protein